MNRVRTRQECPNDATPSDTVTSGSLPGGGRICVYAATALSRRLARRRYVTDTQDGPSFAGSLVDSGERCGAMSRSSVHRVRFRTFQRVPYREWGTLTPRFMD